eukprot:scaffold37934_cov39-Attheya_sp.AAC.1
MVRTERKATLDQNKGSPKKKKAVAGEKKKQSSGKKDPPSSPSGKKKRFAFWKSGDDKSSAKKKDNKDQVSNNNKASKKQTNDDEKVSESAAVARSTTPETSSATKQKSAEKSRAAAAAAAAAVATKNESIKKPEMVRQESEPFDVVQDKQLRVKQGPISPVRANAAKSASRLAHSPKFPSAAEDLLLETLTDEEDEPELVAVMDDHLSDGLGATVMAANQSPANKSPERATSNMSKQALVAASLAAAAKKSFKASSSRSIVADVEPKETSSFSSTDLDPMTPTFASRAMPMDESNEDNNNNSKPTTPQPAGIVDSGSVYYDAVRRNIYDEEEEVPEQASYSSLAINQRSKPKLSMPRFHNLQKEKKESAKATSSRSLGGSSRSLGGMNSRAQAQQSTAQLAKPSGDEPMVVIQDGTKPLSSKLRNGTAFVSLDSMSAVVPLHQRTKKKKTKIDNISEVDDIALLKNDDLIQDPLDKDRDNKSVGAHSSSSAGSMSAALSLLRNRNKWKKLDVDEEEDERHSLSDHSSRFAQTPNSSTSRALPPSREDSSASKSEDRTNRRAVAAAGLGAAGVAAAVASSDGRSRPDTGTPFMSPLEATEKENNAPNKENDEDEDSVFDLDGDDNDEATQKSKALAASPAAPALRKSKNGFISPSKSNRVMFAVEDDSNLETELRRADGRKSTSSPGDSMSVVSGMSAGRSVMTEGTYASSVYTTSSANTQSSRKRRPGAAKKRMAKAKEAELKNSKGWHESIREAAATNNRVWNPSKGWIDYEEPESEETGLEDGRNEKLHISLKNVSKRSPSNQANSSDSVSRSPSTSVPFPSDWEKDRSEMIPIKENEDGDDHSADELNEEKKVEPLSPPRSPARSRAAQGEGDSPNMSWVDSMRAATAKLNTGNRQWDPEQGWTENGPPVSEIVTLSPSRKNTETQSDNNDHAGQLGVGQPSLNDVPISSVAEEADENSTQTSDQSSTLSGSPRSMGVVSEETDNDVGKVAPSKEGLSDWIQQASANLGGSQPESSMTEIESDGAVASVPSKSSALPTNKVPKGSRNRLLLPPGVGAKSRTPKAGDQRDSSITSSKKSGASAGYVELSSNGSVRSIAEEMRSISDPSLDDGTTATNETRSLDPVSLNAEDFSVAVTERQSFNLSSRGAGVASGKAPTVHVVKEKMSKSDRDLFASNDEDGTRGGGSGAQMVLKDSKSTDDDSRNSDTWDNSGFGDDSDSEIVSPTSVESAEGNKKEFTKKATREMRRENSSPTRSVSSLAQQWEAKANAKKEKPTTEKNSEPVFVASGDDDSVFKFKDRSKIPKDDDDSIFMFSDVGSPLRLDQASLAKHEARTKNKEEPPLDNFGFPDAVEDDMYLDTLAAALSRSNQTRKDPETDQSRSIGSRGDPDGRLGADVDDRASDFTKGSTIEKATFFSRLQACAAPIIPRFNTENPSDDSLSAHLAFLKRSPNNNPSPSSNSARSFPSPAFVCGRPDTIFEEDDDKTNNDESTRQSLPNPPRTRSRPRSNQRASQSSSSSPRASPKRDRGPSPKVGQSSKSVSSSSEMKSPSSDISGGGGFGAKTAYLEALALKTAVSNKKKEDAKRNGVSRRKGSEEDGLSVDTGTSPSVVSSATEQSHSQAWQSFLERKKSNSGRKSKTGSSAKSSSDNDVSRAAEKYATEKVEEMMANMPSPSESNRTNPKFQEYGGQSSNRSDSGSSMMDGVSRGRTKKKSSSAKAAEDLAAARVEAMMMAMSSTKLDEGGM